MSFTDPAFAISGSENETEIGDVTKLPEAGAVRLGACVVSTPVPVSAILNGLPLSLLTIASEADFAPVPVGAKRTVKVVLLPDVTGELGCAVTVNSAES